MAALAPPKEAGPNLQPRVMAYDDRRLAPFSLAKAESVVIKVPATPAIEKCLINSDKEVNGSAIVKM